MGCWSLDSVMLFSSSTFRTKVERKTWNLVVNRGKLKEHDTEVSEKVVLSLADGLFNDDRTMYTDNYYTSVPLVLRMRKRKTHIVAALRSSRKYIPRKLKKGEIAAQ
ncbi:unnamed protein product [Parnassius apollo]|uniref:(apollo) hypothetical protein n=1 Tax=Parnassius apollo TaxID=110799 RepID=A0A8S3Y690_PARAO|nr:unnamed protein product [Parnassius apollo]